MIVDVKSIFARNVVLHDLFAERSLLAAVLFDQRSLACLAELECDDFTLFQHGAIFSAIRNVEAVGADVTVDSVFAELARSNRPHAECQWEIAQILGARVAMDTSPVELRWLFDRVRRCRLRRERLAA